MKFATAWLFITPTEAERLMEAGEHEEPQIEAFGQQIIRIRSSDGKYDLFGPGKDFKLSPFVLKLTYRDKDFPWDKLFVSGVVNNFFRFNADAIEEYTLIELGGAEAEPGEPNVKDFLQA